MKRFGILFLLSASYAGLLTLVFSSDFSRENSFLLSPSPKAASGKAFDAPVMGDYGAISHRIAALDYDGHTKTVAKDNHFPSEQSPESADDN